MRVIVGRKVLDVSGEDLAQKRSRFALTLIDVGTGDGRFVYRYAAAHPDTFCIGIDPVRAQMREISAKVARKPSRGGLPNAFFLEAPIENLPAELEGVADHITVNYPWGSLLAALVVPHVSLVREIARLGKRGATLTILFNNSVFQDEEYMTRLSLPATNEQTMKQRVAPQLKQLGIEIASCSVFEGHPPQWTSWGRRLVAGSSRKTMAVSAVITR
ncbi:MAG: class I SAM-dependent methyltransferase [Acidobacteriota bacterium]|jgi:16S rRNA (adenine(1408)-N(1))-methyltransferase